MIWVFIRNNEKNTLDRHVIIGGRPRLIHENKFTAWRNTPWGGGKVLQWDATWRLRCGEGRQREGILYGIVINNVWVSPQCVLRNANFNEVVAGARVRVLLSVLSHLTTPSCPHPTSPPPHFIMLPPWQEPLVCGKSKRSDDYQTLLHLRTPHTNEHTNTQRPPRACSPSIWLPTPTVT